MVTLLIAVASLAVISLSGCQGHGKWDGQEIGDELRRHEATGTAIIDFDALVPGEWRELVIACQEADNESVNDALGFVWKDAPDMKNTNYSVLAIFSTGSEVESYIAPGSDDFFEDLYFLPCPSIVQEDVWPGAPLSIDRSESSVEFRLDAREVAPYWYVPTAELQRLSGAE